MIMVWRAWVARAAIGDLLVDLGSMSGRPLQAALAKALGDPTLTLAYWLPQFGSYTDSEGRKLELPTDDGKRLVAMARCNRQARRVAPGAGGRVLGTGFPWFLHLLGHEGLEIMVFLL